MFFFSFSFDRCRQSAEEGGEFRVKAPETLTVSVQGIVLLVKSFIVIRMNEPSEKERGRWIYLQWQEGQFLLTLTLVLLHRGQIKVGHMSLWW